MHLFALILVLASALVLLDYGLSLELVSVFICPFSLGLDLVISLDFGLAATGLCHILVLSLFKLSIMCRTV